MMTSAMSEVSEVSESTALRLVLAPVRSQLTAAIAAAVLGGVLGVAGFTFLAWSLRALLQTPDDRGAMVWLLLAALAATLVRFALRAWSFRISHLASYELEELLRSDLTEHLARLPLGEVQRLGSGAVKKIVQDDVRALHGLVADATPLAGVAVATPVAATVVMFGTDWRLTLAALAAVPLTMFTMWLASRDHPEQRQRYDAANEAVNAAVVEFAQGMPVVRTFDDGSTTFSRFQWRVTDFTTAIDEWNATSRTPALFTRTFIAPLPTLLAILVVGSLLVGQGTLDVAQLLVFLVIGTSVVEGVTPLMWLNHYVAESRAAAVRIASLLAMPAMLEPLHPQPPVDASISFGGVRFGYGSGAVALDGIDLDIPAGTVCALVGPSGSGKSTITRLVARFWDVEAGSVRVGGVDVREIDSQELLRHLALVFQEPFLASDTVAANIRLARPSATDAEVEAAAKAARVHDFVVHELPLGYQTVVGERGGRLSGGQRQRIALARAILADAPIVILDEATAFADPENEALIQDAVAELASGKTVLVIAHRLASVVGADQIVVLDRGRIVERGKHPELIAANGQYARMWRQAERAQGWQLGGRS